ncbi:MAG: hypothetical protein QG657_3909 [Acidobacteriota bacterium]|nr:hypothetical protein [Acidobacteriota bacterium]
MQIEIDRIDSKGLVLDDKVALDENLLIEEEGSFLEDIDYSMYLSRENEKIRVKGNIHTVVSIPCVRCLEPFDFKIDSPFSITLLPGQAIELTSESLGQDDMDYSFYEGNSIDVAKILMEQVNLFIPIKPVCTPSCRGLCPHCGVNFNREHCQCESSHNEISYLFENIKR